jgi:hypothetical protein
MTQAPSPKAQATTVALPLISAPQLADLVQRMIAGEPEAAARIQRGAGTLLSGAVHDTPELGVYRVDGCAGRVYTASSGTCDCPDSTHRAVTCKHQHAARILSAASAVAAYERAQARWLLTARGEAALAARA